MHQSKLLQSDGGFYAILFYSFLLIFFFSVWVEQDKDRESSGHKSRRERKEEEREKRDRDRSYEIHEDRSQSSIRIKEESLMQDGPPANKRLLLDDDVSLNMRMTPIGLPGANIKITSRGTYVARAKLWLETKREMVGNWVFKTNKQINK